MTKYALILVPMLLYLSLPVESKKEVENSMIPSVLGTDDLSELGLVKVMIRHVDERMKKLETYVQSSLKGTCTTAY